MGRVIEKNSQHKQCQPVLFYQYSYCLKSSFCHKTVLILFFKVSQANVYNTVYKLHRASPHWNLTAGNCSGNQNPRVDYSFGECMKRSAQLIPPKENIARGHMRVMMMKRAMRGACLMIVSRMKWCAKSGGTETETENESITLSSMFSSNSDVKSTDSPPPLTAMLEFHKFFWWRWHWPTNGDEFSKHLSDALQMKQNLREWLDRGRSWY